MIASIIFDRSISQGRSFFEKSPGEGKRFINPSFHSGIALVRHFVPQSWRRLPKYPLKMAKIAILSDDVIDRYRFSKKIQVANNLRSMTFHMSPRSLRSHQWLLSYGWQKISLRTHAHTHTHRQKHFGPLRQNKLAPLELRLRRSSLTRFARSQLRE